MGILVFLGNKSNLGLEQPFCSENHSSDCTFVGWFGKDMKLSTTYKLDF